MAKIRFTARTGSVLMAVLVGGLCWLGIAGPASAAVTPEQAAAAAERGATWFEATQSNEGALAAGLGGGERFGEWTLTALAAGGINAADSRTTLSSSTAQSFYDDFWTVRGPGAIACPAGGGSGICELQPDGLPTDSARTVLSAIAGGLQPSRISTGRDYVSRLAFWWSGDQIGYRDLLNDDIFGILALDHAGAPDGLLETLALKVRSEQLPDGGWHWRSSTGDRPLPGKISADTDMTAAAIGSLCAAGADPAADEAIQRGLALIKSRQAGGSGGFSTGSSPDGVNTSTTAWVTSAFNRCGIDPQAPEWTVAGGKTPFDFLLAMQNDNGSFRYMPSNQAGSANLMASYQAVSPLGGNDWSGEAPARTSLTQPRVKPAPYVNDGAVVPLTLIIDHGEKLPLEDRSRMCRVEIPEGSDLAAVLTKAETGSEPHGCVAGVDAAANGDGVEVNGLNGAAGDWTVEVNGEGESETANQALGLGDMVVLRYRGDGQANPPAIVPVSQIDGKAPADPGNGSGPGTGPGPGPAPGPDTKAPDKIDPIRQSYFRARVVGKPKVRRGRAIARVSCPKAARAAGCAVTATFSARKAGRKFRSFAATGIEIPAGKARTVRVRTAKLKRRLGRAYGKRKIAVRVVVGTRSPDGVIRYSRARNRVRGR